MESGRELPRIRLARPQHGPVNPVSGNARRIQHQQRVSPVEQLIDDWYELACKCGITVTDEDDVLRPDIDQAITRTVTASIWSGMTVGYLTFTDSYRIPHRLKRYLCAAPCVRAQVAVWLRMPVESPKFTPDIKGAESPRT